MTLREYIREQGLTQAEAAHQLGLSRQVLALYIRQTIPRPVVMRRIHQWSNGLVDANAFYRLEGVTP